MAGWAAAVAGQSDSRCLELQLKTQVEQHADSYEANHRLGEFYASQTRFSAAVIYLRRAYELDHSAYDNAYDLALSELRAGDTNAARKLIQQLLKQNDRSELHNLLAGVEEASGNFKGAAAEYETAARMDPSEKNLFDLGSQLLEYHGYQQGLQVFTYATAKFPESAKLRVGLGVAQYSLGQYKEAVETLCRAVDLNPKDTRALDFLGKMYNVAPELSGEVTKRLEHFAKLYPGNAAANYYFAMSLRERTTAGNSAERDQRAKALLLKAIAEDPGLADAHYQLGLIYQDEGLDSKAIHEFAAAVRIRPDLKSAHYRLAQLYTKEGKSDLARQEYRTVQALSGK